MKLSSLRLIKGLVVSCSCASLLSGCASVVGWNTYDVQINSTPPATEFVIRNAAGEAIAEGVTPTLINLMTSAGFFKPAVYSITSIDTNNKPQKYVLRPQVNPAYYANFLFGIVGLPGAMLIDPMTGAMYKLPTTADISQPAESTPTGSIVAETDLDELDAVDQWDKPTTLDTIEKVDAAIERNIYGPINTRKPEAGAEP
ncbi:MAG: hypothetical protein V3U76_17830 [Granulosicoccus sp.]